METFQDVLDGLEESRAARTRAENMQTKNRSAAFERQPDRSMCGKGTVVIGLASHWTNVGRGLPWDQRGLIKEFN